MCFQLPAVMLQGLTVVVSPLISLMADQVRQLRRLNVPVLFMNSSQSHEEQREVFSELKRGFAGLLYVAPERFVGGMHSVGQNGLLAIGRNRQHFPRDGAEATERVTGSADIGRVRR